MIVLSKYIKRNFTFANIDLSLNTQTASESNELRNTTVLLSDTFRWKQLNMHLVE